MIDLYQLRAESAPARFKGRALLAAVACGPRGPVVAVLPDTGAGPDRSGARA